MTKLRMFKGLTGLFAGVLLCTAAVAGRLEFGSPQIDGENVTMPIVLSGDNGTGVSTMNFDLKYDPAVFEPVFVGEGAASKAADKQVQFNVRSDGDARVIVVGLNQTTMQNGEVANVIFKRVGQSTDQTNLRIVNTSFASSDAAEVPSRGDSQAVRFDGNTPEDDPNDDESTDSPSERDNDTDPTNDNSGNDGDNSGRNDDPTNPNPNNPSRPGNTPVYDSAQQPQSGQPAGSSASPRSEPISTRVQVMDDEAGSGAAADPGRLSQAMDQADNARASISAPAEGGEAQSGTAAATEAGEEGTVEGTTPAPGAERIQVAKSDAAMESSPANAAPGNATSDSPESAEADGTASEPAAAQAQARGGDMQLFLIVGGVVVAAIIGLVLVRNRLFA